MASFSAQLRVAGHVFPVLRCAYHTSQATDGRGRAATKVHYHPVELVLDVPDSDVLLAWAADPHKRQAADIVFLDPATGSALETLHLAAAYCVGYRESFASGDVGTGAYQCHLTLSDPDGFTLLPGGPSLALLPGGGLLPSLTTAAEETALTQTAEVITETVVEETAPVSLGVLARLLALLPEAAAAAALAVFIPTNSRNDPGYQSEWDFQSRHQPPTDKEQARLAYLEAERENGRTLTTDEQTELLALLGKIKGIHVSNVSDLNVTAPLYGNQKSLPGFYYISLAYTKRSKADTKVLRTKFDPIREKFLKDLAADPATVAHLKQAGATDDDLLRMAVGKPPLGWQVHHKLPLDDGGDNSVSNLLLIKGDPYHKALTNYQNAATFKMAAGETRTLKWPMHTGNVYP